jgi:hypothetical protein
MPEPDASVPAPRITAVEAPAPILEGTVLRVTGVSLDRLGATPTLHVSAARTTFDLASVPHGVRGEHLFLVSSALFDALGAGPHEVELEASGDGVRTERFLDTWEIATDLALALDAPPSGDVHRNDVVVLRGAGFASSTESTSVAHFTGTFTPEGGSASPIDVRIPIALAERMARDRAVLVLTTDLGGLWPGTFAGDVSIESTLLSGAMRTTPPAATTLRFGRPELYSLSPTMASVGRILTVSGAGFLGGADRPTEATIVRVSGTFTPEGGTAAPFAMDFVPRFVSGAEVRLVIETRVTMDAVVARAFGVTRGELLATATPVTIAGTDEVSGMALPFRIVLGSIVQVVELRFLPGFYDTLDRFGLAAAVGEIGPAIERRVEEIYAGYNVDVRLEEPDDFDGNAYAVVEVGGPDPNGNGLFGYDNTNGKDVGNLRLFDRIGGANAETQMDGYPGYGGVFVQSMLWWSSHPDLPIARPVSAPDPDPIFDRLFDPVRLRPATLAEVMGVGDPARAAEVRAAIDALASIVGETTAHELGHSFGLAQPYGSATSFHNDGDGDGCLMDRGGDRPLGERAQQGGFARTQLCYDEPAYLETLLGP